MEAGGGQLPYHRSEKVVVLSVAVYQDDGAAFAAFRIVKSHTVYIDCFVCVIFCHIRILNLYRRFIAGYYIVTNQKAHRGIPYHG